MPDWKRIDPTRRDTAEETQAVRKAELQTLADELQTAELSGAEFDAKRIRGERGRNLFFWHEDGMSIQALADAAGITREDAYDAIDNYRSVLRGLPH